MPKRMSIAAARDQLTRVVKNAEHRSPVVLTRRGQPVAVVLSYQEYEKYQDGRSSFSRDLEKFREEEDLQQMGLQPDEWLPVRDPSPGRGVTL